MINFLEKYWIYLSIVLILITITSMFLLPAITQPMAWIVIIIGTGVAVIRTINRHYQKYLKLHHNRRLLMRNAGIDVIGVLLAIIVAVWLATIITARVVPAVAQAAETANHGTGFLAGIIVGLVSALGIGLGIGFIIRWIWGKIMAKID